MPFWTLLRQINETENSTNMRQIIDVTRLNLEL